jgi:mRNA interferase MazF
MVRGTIVWVVLDPSIGAEVPKTRPCVIVSRTVANENSRTVTVVPLSSVRGRQRERLVQPVIYANESRLSKNSRALCDQVRTIDKARLHRIVAVLTDSAISKINQGLILHLALESS